MKKCQNFLLLMLGCCLSASLWAQVPPQAFNYSAVARDATGQPIAETALGIQISILQGSVSGDILYSENHVTETDEFGLFNLVIGGGAIQSGDMSSIPWGEDDFFIQVGMDVNGGINFSLMGTTQLLSVPYALHASNGVPGDGTEHYVLTWCSGAPLWTATGRCPGSIENLDCTVQQGSVYLVENFTSSNQLWLSYTGGDGGGFNTIEVTSTGVEGLILTLPQGQLNEEDGIFELYITGTPTSAGMAIFNISILGFDCELTFEVLEGASISSFTCAPLPPTTYICSGIADNLTHTLDYVGGNAGSFNSLQVSSTGVEGLTLSLSGGVLNTGNGTFTLRISGTPQTAGEGRFTFELFGIPCEISFEAYDCGCDPAGSTEIVDVTNPSTGKTWMDRNLGASQAATSSTDANAYGDLYQWGRGADGHQCRNSATTTTLSSTDQPGHGSFITTNTSPFDWRSPQNTNLWQGVNGVNNPCPSGYRLPTEAELTAERTSWSSNYAAGAFASPLKLPIAGGRSGGTGSLSNVGIFGGYWSSAVSSTYSRDLVFASSNADMVTNGRAFGLSVRCLKD